MSGPVLVVRSGPDAGARLTISGPLIIGRLGADVTLQDAQVSRRHAEIRPTATGFEIRDLGSANGTTVNGTRLDGDHPVTSGDVIQVGLTLLEIEPDAAAQPTVVQNLSSAATEDVRPGVPDPVATVAPPSDAVVPRPLPAFAAPPGPDRPFSPAPQGSRGGPATREPAAIVLTFATIVLTGLGLILYFALR